MPTFGYDELEHALEESVKLQSHYADLLNMYDSGKRLKFENAKEWLLKLREIYKEQDKIYNKIIRNPDEKI